MMNPLRRFPSTIQATLSQPTPTTLLRPISSKPTSKDGDDDWNDAWESAWLPNDLSDKHRAPWESDVNFSLSNTPSTTTATPDIAAAEVDAETKAFVEDMADNWEQRRKSVKTQQRQEKEEKLKEMEKNPFYTLESIKRDYRVQKQRIHAGLWVKEIEKQEEDKLGDGGGDGIERLLDSCSEIFDSPNDDMNNSKIPSSSEFKNKPDGWETTAKAQDGSVWEMSQREEDILIQEFERRIAFSKFQGWEAGGQCSFLHGEAGLPEAH